MWNCQRCVWWSAAGIRQRQLWEGRCQGHWQEMFYSDSDYRYKPRESAELSCVCLSTFTSHVWNLVETIQTSSDYVREDSPRQPQVPHPLTSTCPRLRSDAGVEWRATLTELSLCYSIVYYYNGAQWYEQFLQVGRLYRALILLGVALFLSSSEHLCIFGLNGAIYIYLYFCYNV